MKSLKMKMNISDLKHPERNPRKHPQKQIEEMKRSIKMFGQIRDVVVDETNTILAGNGLVMAMRELGKTEVDVLKFENLTENQKKKLMIADNQITSLGVDDYGMIEQFIKELAEDTDIPGYDEETINMLIAESEEVTESALNYGSYNPEQFKHIVAEQKNREENGFVPVEQTYTPQPSAPVESVSSQPISGYEGEQKQEVNKFIICPHCGEKIYI